jgi:hypothetical protein
MRMRDLTERMERLAASGDPEDAHARADDLLIDAIDCLAAYATDTPDEREEVALIAAYRRVPKWYA